MTTEQVIAMTAEDKNKRLAELLGWTEIFSSAFGSIGFPPGRKDPGEHKQPLPDFSGDLNAIAEARKELILTDDQRIQFAQTLAQLLGWPMATRYELIDASADIQSTALILTLS